MACGDCKWKPPWPCPVIADVIQIDQFFSSMQFRISHLFTAIAVSAASIWLFTNYPWPTIIAFASLLVAFAVTLRASFRPRFKEFLGRRRGFASCVAIIGLTVFSLYFLSSGPVILLMRTYMKPNPSDPIQNLIFAIYTPLFTKTDNPLWPVVNWYVLKWIGEAT